MDPSAYKQMITLRSTFLTGNYDYDHLLSHLKDWICIIQDAGLTSGKGGRKGVWHHVKIISRDRAMW
jgi:hypothetical protein